jgi:DNA-binding transcriptional MerR regulator
MGTMSSGLSLQELSDQSGTPVRTIRFYITEQLLPGPQGRGTSTFYTEEHLQRLLLIRQLTARHVPLSEVREQLSRVSAAELARLLLDEKRQRERQEEARTSSPREYLTSLLEDARGQRQEAQPSLFAQQLPVERETWRRIRIAPGIEIHVTLEAERKNGRLAAEIVELARQAAQQDGRRKST